MHLAKKMLTCVPQSQWQIISYMIGNYYLHAFGKENVDLRPPEPVGNYELHEGKILFRQL